MPTLATKCRFLDRGGYPLDLEYARKHLTANEIYTVQWTDADDFSATVTLKEFPEHDFNTVMFDDVAEGRKWLTCSGS